jgi:hypothetical protein
MIPRTERLTGKEMADIEQGEVLAVEASQTIDIDGVVVGPRRRCP